MPVAGHALASPSAGGIVHVAASSPRKTQRYFQQSPDPSPRLRRVRLRRRSVWWRCATKRYSTLGNNTNRCGRGCKCTRRCVCGKCRLRMRTRGDMRGIEVDGRRKSWRGKRQEVDVPAAVEEGAVGRFTRRGRINERLRRTCLDGRGGRAVTARFSAFSSSGLSSGFLLRKELLNGVGDGAEDRDRHWRRKEEGLFGVSGEVPELPNPRPRIQLRAREDF